MTDLRKLNIILGFFIVWFFVIGVQLVTITLFDHQIARALHPIAALFTLLIGLSCQVLFQGPSPNEVLEAQRQKWGEEACSVSRIFLLFNIDRTVRIVIVSFVFSAVSLLTNLFRGDQIFLGFGVIFLFVVAVILRTFLIHRRVATGHFGSNEYEAREILRFLIKMYTKHHKDFHPPGGMKRLIEPINDAVDLPSGAEYAK